METVLSFAIYTLPDDGVNVPAIIFARVLFPAPFTPTIPSLSPSFIEKFILFNTTSVPYSTVTPLTLKSTIMRVPVRI